MSSLFILFSLVTPSALAADFKEVAAQTDCDRLFYSRDPVGVTFTRWAKVPVGKESPELTRALDVICKENRCLTFCTPEDSIRVSKEDLQVGSACRKGDDMACMTLRGRLAPMGNPPSQVSPMLAVCGQAGGPVCFRMLGGDPALTPLQGAQRLRSDGYVGLKMACVTGVRQACEWHQFWAEEMFRRKKDNCNETPGSCMVYALALVAHGRWQEALQLASVVCTKDGICNYMDIGRDLLIEPEFIKWREMLEPMYLDICRRNPASNACHAKESDVRRGIGPNPLDGICRKDGRHEVKSSSGKLLARVSCRGGMFHGESWFGPNGGESVPFFSYTPVTFPFKQGVVDGKVQFGSEVYVIKDGKVIEEKGRRLEDGLVQGSHIIETPKGKRKFVYRNGEAVGAPSAHELGFHCESTRNPDPGVQKIVQAHPLDCTVARPSVTLDSKGIVRTRRTEKAGVLHVQNFHDGALRFETRCERRSRSGTVRLYDDLGSLSGSFTLKNGKLEGDFKGYSQGFLVRSTPFRDGIQLRNSYAAERDIHGVWREVPDPRLKVQSRGRIDYVMGIACR